MLAKKAPPKPGFSFLAHAFEIGLQAVRPGLILANFHGSFQNRLCVGIAPLFLVQFREILQRDVDELVIRRQPRVAEREDSFPESRFRLEIRYAIAKIEAPDGSYEVTVIGRKTLAHDVDGALQSLAIEKPGQSFSRFRAHRSKLLLAYGQHALAHLRGVEELGIALQVSVGLGNLLR